METIDKVPTAEEFLKQYQKGGDSFCVTKGEAINKLIEFAKLHVRRALKEASEVARTEKPEKQTQSMAWNNVSPNDYHFFDVDKESILNAYPEDNIR